MEEDTKGGKTSQRKMMSRHIDKRTQFSHRILKEDMMKRV
jgi:hypothetical protein